ncbi:MAG: right-handed parallel beta-helix repeat-containing protein [Chloroflexota bacterium]
MITPNHSLINIRSHSIRWEKRIRIYPALFAGLLALFLYGLPQLAQVASAQDPICRVNASVVNPGIGDTWENAYATLQEALSERRCTEIWVAAGVYYPDEGGGQVDNNPRASFALTDTLQIYGGFSGIETSRDVRDWENNVTVLSGDIDSNDTNKDADGITPAKADIVGVNALHVLTSTNVSVGGIVDGITITGGSAIIGGNAITDTTHCQDLCGGGLYSFNSSLTLRNVSFVGNQSDASGGGIYAAGDNTSLLTLNNIRLLRNTANGSGGGIYIVGDSLSLQEGIIQENQANSGGGAIHSEVRFVEVISSTIENNNGGAGEGGGLFIRAEEAYFKENLIHHNRVQGEGGGLFVRELQKSTFYSNTISNNAVSLANVPRTRSITETSVITGAGGGLYMLNSTAYFTNNLFLRNAAATEGGGLYVAYSPITMTNNLVVQNQIPLSDTYGGGLYLASVKGRLLHNTIADNRNTHSESTVAGLYVVRLANKEGYPPQSDLEMINNLIAGQKVGLQLQGGNTALIRNNFWSNGQTNWTGDGFYKPESGGNRFGIPRFIQPDAVDYRIQRYSGAFDIGFKTKLAVDRRGVERLRAFAPDAGALEHRYDQGVYMDVDAEPLFVRQNEPIAYTIRVVNHSPVPLNNVVVQVAQSGGPQQVDGISQVGTVPSVTCGGLQCTIPNFQVNGAVTITLKTKATGQTPPNGLLEMQTRVSATINGQEAQAEVSDRPHELTTYVQNCVARYEGKDYFHLQDAVDAVDDTDSETSDLIKVSGYCGDMHEIDGKRQSLYITKTLTLQGGWDDEFTTRNPITYPTTIDAAGTGRVLYITTKGKEPVIESIRLHRGDANGLGGGPQTKDAGGGVYILESTATLTNVHITEGNSPDHGGGLYIHADTPAIIQNSRVENNRAGQLGGGIYVYQASPRLIDTIVRNNQAKAGGGYFLDNSRTIIQGIGGDSCLIQNNQASGSPFVISHDDFARWLSRGGGGGLFIEQGKNTLTNCTISQNQSEIGGGIFAHSSAGTVSQNLITENQTTGRLIYMGDADLHVKTGGGGLYIQKSNLSIQNNRILNNFYAQHESGGQGGGLHLFRPANNAQNGINGNVFAFNRAAEGSAMYAHDVQNEVPLINNTIAHNVSGPAIFVHNMGKLAFTNSIIAFHQGEAIQTTGQAEVDLERTLWYQNGSRGVGNVSDAEWIEGDPAFKADGYHIKQVSAAYNAGINFQRTLDIDGEIVQPEGGIAQIDDLGADEYTPATQVRYVAPGGNGSPPCADFENPCGQLQDAIDAALDGDLIKMAGGDYTVILERNGQRQIGYLDKSVTIQGGYYRFTNDNSLTEGLYTLHDWEDPFPDINPTILNAGDGGRVFYITGGETKPTLSGLQLQGGNALGLKGADNGGKDGGGAIYVFGASPTITDVTVSGSQADYGGALYLHNVISMTLENLTFRDNSATERGGAIYLFNSPIKKIHNIQVEKNVAPEGAGIFLEKSETKLTQNTLINNGDGGTQNGGALYLLASPATLEKNNITGNRAENGGGLYIDGKDELTETAAVAIVGFNEIVSNSATRGGGLYVQNDKSQIQLNTVRENSASQGGGIFISVTETSLISNTISSNQALSGAGIYLDNTSDAATIRGNFVSQNRASGSGTNDGGGGFYLANAAVPITANTVVTNSAATGGGVFIYQSSSILEKNLLRANQATTDGGGLYLKLSDATLKSNQILANTTSGGSGGGLYIRLSQPTLEANQVHDNRAALFGGGLFLDESNAQLKQDSIRLNQASSGGGIYVLRSDKVEVTENVAVHENEASQNGGGIYVRLSDLKLRGHQILTNTAGNIGGGLYLDESNASAITSNLLRANQAGQKGGGMAIVNRSNAQLGANAIIQNRTDNVGAGIYIEGSSPLLENFTIAQNTGGDGSGIVIETFGTEQSNVTLVNTILANQPVGVRVSGGSTATLTHTLWYNNQTHWVTAGSGLVDTGNAQSTAQNPCPAGDKGNLCGDPGFLTDGYHLHRDSGSLAINNGSDTNMIFSLDIDGEARPQQGRREIGADEIVPELVAEIRISGNSVEIVNNDNTPELADHTDFGGVNMHGEQIVRTFTIHNIGNTSLTLSSPTISGPHASEFLLTSLPASNIAAGGSSTFDITFAPSAIGIRSATVTISSSDVAHSPFTFEIQGMLNADATPEQPLDPVVLKGADLSGLVDEESDAIFVYVYTNGEWSDPIPSQVDELTATGVYTSVDNKIFDQEDELVFMASDLGMQAPENALANIPLNPGFYAVEITDPVNVTQKGWVYVGTSTKMPQNDNQNYIDYHADTGTVSASNYSLKIAADFAGFEALYLNQSDQNVLDRSKRRIEVNGNGSQPQIITENDLLGNKVIKVLKDGPVRVILQELFTLTGINGEYASHFNIRYFGYGTQLQVESHLALSDATVRYLESTDFSQDLGVGTLYNNNVPGGVAIDGNPDAGVDTLLSQPFQLSHSTGRLVYFTDPSPIGTEPTTYYKDNAEISLTDTGDGQRYGEIGYLVTGQIENTAVVRSRLYILPPATGNEDNVIERYTQRNQNPLIISTQQPTESNIPALSVGHEVNVSVANIGDELTYRYHITNSGKISLTNIVAKDSKFGLINLATTLLRPGESTIGRVKATVQASELPGPLVTTVVVTGTSPLGTVVTATTEASVSLVNVAISLNYTVGIDGYAPACGTGEIIKVPVDTTVSYCYTISNTGDIPLVQHSLTDSKLGNIFEDKVFRLDPGQSVTTVELGELVRTPLSVGSSSTVTWTAETADLTVDAAETVAMQTGSQQTIVVRAVIPGVEVQVSTENDDQDSDGVPDNVEGVEDSNDNGIPDFLDPAAPTALDEVPEPDSPVQQLYLPLLIEQ